MPLPQNTKHEIRNPKQARSPNAMMLETCFENCWFDIRICFGLRYSNFVFCYYGNLSHFIADGRQRLKKAIPILLKAGFLDNRHPVSL